MEGQIHPIKSGKKCLKFGRDKSLGNCKFFDTESVNINNSDDKRIEPTFNDIVNKTEYDNRSELYQK